MRTLYSADLTPQIKREVPSASLAVLRSHPIISNKADEMTVKDLDKNKRQAKA